MKSKLILLVLFLSITFTLSAQIDDMSEEEGFDRYHTLCLMASEGKLDSMKQYIAQYGIDLVACDSIYGIDNRLIYYALYHNQYQVINYLMSEVPNYRQLLHSDLHIAALNKDFDQVQSMIREGAYSDSRDANGFTVLMIAILYDDLQATQQLLDLEANPNVINADGCSPLLLAVLRQNEDVVKLLINNLAEVDMLLFDQSSALTQATFLPSLSVVKILLDAGANPNRTRNLYPLNNAIMMGYVDIAQALIDAHSDLNVEDIFEASPLLMAIDPIAASDLYSRMSDAELDTISKNQAKILKPLLQSGLISTTKTKKEIRLCR